MTSIASSSTPKWDSRNQGFIPPSQLQQWKEQPSNTPHQFPSTQESQSQPPPPPPSDMPRTLAKSPPPAPPKSGSPPTHTHTRTISAFSLFKSRPASQDGQHHASPPILQRHSTAGALNGSSSHAQGANEHGQLPQNDPPQAQPPSSTPMTSSATLIPNRQGSMSNPTGSGPTLHPEIRSVVQLTVAHARKIYYAGPLIRRLERQPDGQRPTKDEGWRDVWGQLGGTTLSLWDMQEIEEANKQGKQAPPSYINVTDAFVRVLGSLTVPGTAISPPKKYTDVITLNTAGSNLLFFACPSTQALLAWTAALRLAAWEKSRLEEIYTAHFIRVTLNDGRAAPTPLVRGKLEGWVRVRVAGQTDWKKLWMVVTAGGLPQDGSSISSNDRPSSPNAPRKNRMSQLFSRDSRIPKQAMSPPSKPILQLFTSPKPKDRKTPVLTMRDIFQAFLVYPERPELITRSTLFKLEGVLGDEEMGANMKNKEGWLLVMPEVEDGNKRTTEMLKWLIGTHDAFDLYGRPRLYSWDPRDPRSLMFGYPTGPHKDQLFLDREGAEKLDPRDDRNPVIRGQLQQMLLDRMQNTTLGQAGSPAVRDRAPSLPPLPSMDGSNMGQPTEGSQRPTPPEKQSSMQLPAFDFDTRREEPEAAQGQVRSLTPITEHSVILGSRPQTGDQPATGMLSLQQGLPPTVPEDSEQSASVLGEPLATSPVTISPPPDGEYRVTRSEDSMGGPSSRPDSKLSNFGSLQTKSPPPPPPADTKSPPPPSALDRQSSVVTTSSASVQFRPASTLSSPSQYTHVTTPMRSSSPHASILTSPYSLRDEPATSAVSTTKSAALAPLRARQDADLPTTPPPLSAVLPNPKSPSLRAPSPHASVLTSPYSILDSSSEPRASANSPRASVLTSPYSVHDSPVERRTSVNSPRSVLTSPYSVHDSPSKSRPAADQRSFQDSLLSSTANTRKENPALPPAVGPTPSSSTQSGTTQSSNELDDDIFGEAGALYYMRHIQQDQGQVVPIRRPPPITESDDEEESDSDSESQYPSTSPPQTNTTSPLRVKSPASPPSSSSLSPPRRGTPMGLDNAAGGSSAPSPNPARTTPRPPPVVRKPSGARAVPGNKTTGGSALAAAQQQHREPARQHHSPSETIDEAMSESDYAPHPEQHSPPQRSTDLAYEDTADALAALTFLEGGDAASSSGPTHAPQASPPSAPIPQVVEPPRGGSPPGSVESSQYRSSFAPSRQAAERKAKTQAQQAAHQAAVHKPGRASGGAKKRVRDPAAWGESSDEEEEEEEEEEEDDEDADSDAEFPVRGAGKQDANGNRPGIQAPRAAPPPVGPPDATGAYMPPRHPRDLPQLPGQMGQGQGGGPEFLVPQPRRLVSDQFSEGRRSQYPEGPRRQPSPQPQYQQYQNQNLGAARQNMWSQVLEPGKGANALPERDTFVQIEPPSHTMTKAFTPHGLLSVGLQDKQDRSAKRQEELARETGASLINVPNKPPPPQTGLLGAVTAHERERKRDGGLGATLTEREREKRIAEDRQRKLDEYQRMQLDQMQQTGSMYGGMGIPPQFTGYNPMMGNPMANPMMMNPMMTGGWGYPGMMNPQHMFAAQQAAQAYQQAMVALSAAGSQVGGDAPGGAAPLNPMMTGASMGMGGFDPRYSMMGMPMMNPQMGMGPGMGMGQGMGQGMMPMGMGMQMTGGGAFDPRFSTAYEGGLNPGQRPYSSQNSSPGQGSPAGPRPVDPSEEPPRASANASPNPQPR